MQLLPVPVPMPVGFHGYWQTNTMPVPGMPWCEGGAPYFYLPFCGDPQAALAAYYLSQGMAHWQLPYRVQAPNLAGPSHWLNQGAEAQYNLNHTHHESSGTGLEGRSPGIHPGRARMGARDETGSGKVWRTPSKNH